MNNDAKPARTTIYLAPETHEALHRVAKAHKRSFNSEVVWALEQYLAQEARRRAQDPPL
jgi:predicted transcriptional regulator